MRFPMILVPELTDAQVQRFRKHMDSARSGWHRKWTESLWRRHQHPSNAALSGWRSDADQKRRLIHFYDEYDLDGPAFVLRNAYLFLHVGLPEAHIAEYEAAIEEGLVRGEWRSDGSVYRRGDLVARIATYDRHPADAARG